MYQFRTVKTDIGELILIGDGVSLEYILFENAELPERYEGKLKANRNAYPLAVKELKQYFRKQLVQFTFPIKINAEGFNRRALEALARVPYGMTISYKDLARRAGSHQAYRAAGSACGRNPLPIVIPCHRVIKSDGSLGGFSGELAIKRKLLDLEQAKYKS